MAHATRYKILVVDDDLALLAEVRQHLAKLGYDVSTTPNGRSALALAKDTPFDLVVLDINFVADKTRGDRPIDGLEVLRQLRDSGNVPVLMLSATSISAVKVMALTIGADDYVQKPFDMQELSARIEAIIRRSRNDSQDHKVLSFKRLRLDPGERRVWKDGNPVSLTGVEFDLLYTMAKRPNHVFTREKLLEIAWKDVSYSVAKVVDVHIGHIRKKTEDNPSHPTLIVTVRGTGYRFEDVPA